MKPIFKKKTITLNMYHPYRHTNMLVNLPLPLPYVEYSATTMN